MQYIYILDYSTPSRVTIEVDDNRCRRKDIAGYPTSLGFDILL